MSDDENLAMAWLGGMATEKDGLVYHKYIEAGSEQEREARAALTRLLRSDRALSASMRFRLAALADPDHAHEPRELVIRPRKRGRQASYLVDVEIARDLAAAMNNNEKLEAAIEVATRRYRTSRSRVQRAWQKHGDVWIAKQVSN